MLAGWIRPSATSACNAILATSRRTGSNDEMSTMFGDSSMRSVTPVDASKALMLRPSRPMMRPFISSLGSWTIVAVTSCAGWLAMRCMTASSTRLASAFRSASERSMTSLRNWRRSSWHSIMTSSRSAFLISAASRWEISSSRWRRLFDWARTASRACLIAAASRPRRSCRASSWKSSNASDSSWLRISRNFTSTSISRRSCSRWNSARRALSSSSVFARISEPATCASRLASSTRLAARSQATRRPWRWRNHDKAKPAPAPVSAARAKVHAVVSPSGLKRMPPDWTVVGAEP